MYYKWISYILCACVHPCSVNSVVLDSLHAYIKNGWASQVALRVKKPPANAGEVKDMISIPGSRKSLEEGMELTPVCLPGESHGQRSLAGSSPQGHKELDTNEVN